MVRAIDVYCIEYYRGIDVQSKIDKQKEEQMYRGLQINISKDRCTEDIIGGWIEELQMYKGKQIDLQKDRRRMLNQKNRRIDALRMIDRYIQKGRCTEYDR